MRHEDQIDVPAEWDLVPKDTGEAQEPTAESAQESAGNESSLEVINTSIVEKNTADQEVAAAEKMDDIARAEVMSAELKHTIEASPIYVSQVESPWDRDERARKLFEKTEAFRAISEYQNADQAYINEEPQKTFMEKAVGAFDGMAERSLPSVRYGMNKFAQLISGYPLMTRKAKDRWNEDMETRDALEDSAARKEHRRTEAEAAHIKATRIFNRTHEVRMGKAPHQQR